MGCFYVLFKYNLININFLLNMTKKAKSEPKKNGRPTEYNEQTKDRICTIVRGLVMLGKSEAEIAKILNIGQTTFSDWKNAHAELSEALKSNDVVNGLLLGRAFDISLGHHYYEESLHPKTGEVIELRKYAKPDSRVMQILLANRLKITDKSIDETQNNKPIQVNIYKGDNPDIEVTND